MRIITGAARGKRLKTLSGESTRPTTERVKEALFSIFHFELEGRRVLDLFAGSGQLGLEALSRGAVRATMVDNSKEAAEVIKANIQSVGLPGAKFINTDACAFVENTGETFDIIFIDPPYSSGLLERVLQPACEHLADGGAIACEHPEKDEIPIPEGMTARHYRYGAIAVTVLRKEVQ